MGTHCMVDLATSWVQQSTSVLRGRGGGGAAQGAAVWGWWGGAAAPRRLAAGGARRRDGARGVVVDVEERQRLAAEGKEHRVDQLDVLQGGRPRASACQRSGQERSNSGLGSGSTGGRRPRSRR